MYNKQHNNIKSAFSLVELSIVLVILGLLTGGILTGRSLIRSAELRAIMSEFEQYRTAINTFEEKYYALPGDMPNATQFWGRATAGAVSYTPCTNPANDKEGPAPRTCDGNGDGYLRGLSNIEYESFRAWQHLANAGLVNGSFTGVSAAGDTYNHAPGENIPLSKIAKAGWGLVFRLSTGFSASSFPRTYDKMFLLFGNSLFTATTGSNMQPVITPEDAWNIDTKMDDGKPAKGQILSHTTALSPCPTSNNENTAEYNLSNPNKDCSLIFLLE